MAQAHPMLVGAATVFVVSDIANSIAYYHGALGFDVTFQYGEHYAYGMRDFDLVDLDGNRITYGMESRPTGNQT
jgi:catechol 2,3-dioxygenase-like lactoylglutathione lyase family enzyme